MAPRSSKFLIQPEAHFVLRPSDPDDPLAPWELMFANGPAYSNEPEHQAVVIALSPSYNTTGDPEGDHDLGVEYLRWVADNLASGLQRNLILPVLGDYVAPNGTRTMMTQDMKDRYGWPPPYGTKIHRDLEDYFTAEQRQMRLDREHDDSPYNIHHKHDPSGD